MPWREMSVINQRRAFVRLAAQDAGRIGGPQISARLQTAEPVRAPQPSGCRTTSDDKLGLSRASDCEFSACFDKSRFSIAASAIGRRGYPGQTARSAASK